MPRDTDDVAKIVAVGDLPLSPDWGQVTAQTLPAIEREHFRRFAEARRAALLALSTWLDQAETRDRAAFERMRHVLEGGGVQ